MTGAEILLAKSIADATGLTDWIASKFGNSSAVAKKIIDTAVAASGAKSKEDVVAILQRDSVKAAEVKAVIEASEMELISLAYQDLQSARSMYSATNHQLSDELAKLAIMVGMPCVVFLIICNGIAVYFINDASIAIAVGNIIGGSITMIWQIINQVYTFHFGSSLGSKMKDSR